MAQALRRLIDGIAESLHRSRHAHHRRRRVAYMRETRGVGIYPTPVLGIVGILDDVSKAVPAHFQRAGDAIVLLWPIPRGETPDPTLQVPLNSPPISQYPLPAFEREPRALEQADATDNEAEENLVAFGSSEFAKAVLRGLWGRRPLAGRRRSRSSHPAPGLRLAGSSAPHATSPAAASPSPSPARISRRSWSACHRRTGSIALAHPLFGLFAEPASTVLMPRRARTPLPVESSPLITTFLPLRIGCSPAAIDSRCDPRLRTLHRRAA